MNIDEFVKNQYPAMRQGMIAAMRGDRLLSPDQVKSITSFMDSSMERLYDKKRKGLIPHIEENEIQEYLESKYRKQYKTYVSLSNSLN